MEEEVAAIPSPVAPVPTSPESALNLPMPSVWRVWVPAMVLLVSAFACMYMVLRTTSDSLVGPLIIAAAILYCGSAFLLAFGGMHDGEARALFAFPTAVEHASKGALGLRKEYNRALTAVEGLQSLVRQETEQLRGIGRDDRRSDYNELEARFFDALAARKVSDATTESWQDRVIELVRSVERVLDTEGLKPEYVSMAERTLADIERLFGPLQFSVVRPERGTPFDSLVHEVVGSEPSDFEPEVVLFCSHWGFVIGDRRIPAKVTISE